MRHEQRFALLPIEVREAGDSAPRQLVGYAATYGVESGVLVDKKAGPFTEVLAPGCFDRTLRDKPDVRALFGHDTSAVLGRTKSGTLRLSADDVGLRYSLDLPDTQLGRDAATMVQRGDIDSCSFGFDSVDDSLELRSGRPKLRTVYDLDLFEMSLIAFPAYDGTTVELRSKHRRVIEVGNPKLILARAKLRLSR